MEIVDLPTESQTNMEVEPPAKIPRTEAVSRSSTSKNVLLSFF